MTRRSIEGLAMMLLVIISMILIYLEKEGRVTQNRAVGIEKINENQSDNFRHADLLLMNETICSGAE
ncbi:MAG: hypothetical protein ABIS36_16215 [Chryseolinea sp.]